ncbi:GNAT family N-acetyltransferase, partial [Spirillospora sp. NPDC049652]
MEIRELTAADLDAALDNRVRAFGHVPEADVRSWREGSASVMAAGRQLGGFDGGRLVSTARVLAFRQWWEGRAVPMGGLAGVTVAPEDRGRGAGRAVVTAALRRALELGDVLSALHPATTTLYRGLGWEHAGGLHRVTMKTEALRGIRADRVPVRRVGPRDAEEIAATIARVHEGARDSGPVDTGADLWRVRLASGGMFAYLADDGFLAYRWAPDNSSLVIDKVVAGSERTARALWAIVGSGASTADSVKANLAPHDPVLWLVAEREHDMIDRTQWMLRVLDAPRAIELRGYRPGVSAEVPLRLTDELLTANTGHWTLTVKDGEGRLEQSAEDATAVQLGPRGLAALYAGIPVSTLRRAG